MLNTLRDAMAIVESLPENRGCTKCDHFEGRRCKHWGMDVPTGALAAGCEQFEENIPF